MGNNSQTCHDRSLIPVPPLMELLANPLSQQAGKCLVIPEGEGYGSSLREFHVNRLLQHIWPHAFLIGLMVRWQADYNR